MKKLIIILAVFSAIFVAEAATFNWSALQIYDAGATTSAGAQYYTGTVSLYAYLTSEGIANSFLVDSATPNATGDIMGNATQTTYVHSATGAEGELVFPIGNVYNFYITFEDTTNNKVFSTANIENLKKEIKVEKDGMIAVTFGNIANYTKDSANWTSSAVPEPTSGLLLLCGLAGLALRRKRV